MSKGQRMSKLGWRTPESRRMAQMAASLGYGVTRTATGHLRCVHAATGAIVIVPSKGAGRLMLNAERELRHNARVSA